jgi:glycosyltransferase involved in cell wall biosynthesis
MLSDLALCRFWSASPGIKNWLVQQTFFQRADALLIEHPWQFQFFVGLDERKLLIYDAHNIEREVKADSLAAISNISSHEQHDWLNEVEGIERLAIQAADFVIACSEGDAREVQRRGAHDVGLVPNSSSLHEESVDPSLVNAYTKHSPYLLVVSSAHAPNVRGISDFLTAYLRLGTIPFKVVIAGGAAAAFQNLTAQLPSQVVLYPSPSDAELAALYNCASIVVVPAFVGGGSNLKTFEALFSGRPVVLAESAAVRAGVLDSLEGVFFASSAHLMAEELSKLALRPQASPFYSHERKALIQKLGWNSNCQAFINKLVRVDERDEIHS